MEIKKTTDLITVDVDNHDMLDFYLNIRLSILDKVMAELKTKGIEIDFRNKDLNVLVEKIFNQIKAADTNNNPKAVTGTISI